MAVRLTLHFVPGRAQPAAAGDAGEPLRAVAGHWGQPVPGLGMAHLQVWRCPCESARLTASEMASETAREMACGTASERLVRQLVNRFEICVIC